MAISCCAPGRCGGRRCTAVTAPGVDPVRPVVGHLYLRPDRQRGCRGAPDGDPRVLSLRCSARGGRGLTGPPVPSVKGRVVTRGPGLAEPRRAQIPVRADLAGRRAQVTPEVVDRRATPEPVTVVDAVNDQSRLEHE